MIVRQAKYSDIQVIIDFQIAMARETENLTLPPEVVKRGVSAIFDDPSHGKYYVAEVNGEVTGSLMTTFEWSDWRNGTILWIQSVYVIPEYRRQGVYTALYSHVRNLVQSDPQLFGIRLYADVSNEIAHKSYLNLGMKADHYITFEWMK